MDALPSWITKMRFQNIRWAATWFQTAPNPFKGFTEGERSGTYRLNALFYWLSQLPIKPLIAHFADFALVNNESERKQFPKLNRKHKILVVIGAVDLTKIEAFKKSHKRLKKIYEAVYQGRFHAQKGVVEMIDIWKNVVSKKPKARLVMIGDGPLMKDVKDKIKKLRLENNILLLGYVFDGAKKYTTFAQSKLVVHPAFYDSGGMAAAEAMAFDLPCVGFELESYKSYYPYGMIKAPTGNIQSFSKKILDLLNNNALKKKISREGMAMIRKNWSWDKRAEDIYNSIAN
jgi:glycosyltransferase involved in cell wall biosynthesis